MLRALFVAFILLLTALNSATAQSESGQLLGVVTIKGGGPLPGAQIETLGSLAKLTTTDNAGRYTLALPPGSVEVRVSIDGFAPQSANVLIAGAQNTVQNFELTAEISEIITVGSRVKGTAAQYAVPVDLLTPEEVERTGAVEINQIIQALAPSFNFPRPTVTDGTDSVRPATLRGLGPDQVLVLINGKRRHTSALVHVNGSIGRGSTGVDMNAIPASAIERIEILRDGAAAQYGSDAIAGVINLVLKDGYDGEAQVSLRGGSTTEGDGELVNVAVEKGWKIGGGSLFATVEYRDRGATNRAGDDPRPQGSRDPVEQPNHQWGDSEAEDIMGFFNAQIPLGSGDSTSFYAFGGLSRREGSHGGFFRRALDDRNFPAIYPNGFLPLIEPEVTDFSLASGVRGGIGAWFWDASLQYGDNQFDFNVSNSLNASFGPAIPPNQTEFYAGTLGFDQLTLNLDLSRQFEVGLAGPLNVAFGAEFRREGYQIEAGEPASYLDGGRPNQFGGRAAPGAQVFPGFRPSDEVDAERDSKALYIDLEGDVFEKLRVGLAGRFEDFDDFGSTSDFKLSLRFQPVKQLVLRGAVSTGFRAPSLGQANFSAVSTNFLAVGGVLQPFEVGTFPVASAVARALGAKDLEPEESDHLSVGLVWNPVDAFQISVDYYSIEIADRIVFSGNFTGPRVAALLAPFNVTGARFFTNAVDTETEGVDVSVAYDLKAWGGDLRLEAGYNQTENKVVGTIATPPQLAGLAEVLFDRTERLRIECGQPEDNLRLTADWRGEKLFTNLRLSRYGKYCLVDRRVVDQEFGEEWLADLEVGWNFDQATVALGVQNLTDEYPDLNLVPNSNLGIFTYPSHSPFGMNGRFVYLRVGYRF